MRTKTVKIHYCDHCDEHYFKLNAMIRHESGCTKNPNRRCKMCEVAGEVQESLDGAKLIMDFTNKSFNKERMNQLKEYFHGCPACILAALRQIPNPFAYDDFNFKEQCKLFWNDQRELRPEDYQ